MNIILNRSFLSNGIHPSSRSLRNLVSDPWPTYVNYDGSYKPTGTRVIAGSITTGSLGGLCYYGGYLYSANNAGVIYRADPNDINGTKTIYATLAPVQYCRSLTTDGTYWYIGSDTSGFIRKYDFAFNFIENVFYYGTGMNAIHALDYYDGKLYAGKLNGDVYEIDPVTYTSTSLGSATYANGTLTGIQVFDDYILYLAYTGSIFCVLRSNISGSIVWTKGGLGSVRDDFIYVDDLSRVYTGEKTTGIDYYSL